MVLGYTHFEMTCWKLAQLFGFQGLTILGHGDSIIGVCKTQGVVALKRYNTSVFLLFKRERALTELIIWCPDKQD